MQIYKTFFKVMAKYKISLMIYTGIRKQKEMR